MPGQRSANAKEYYNAHDKFIRKVHIDVQIFRV